jgi:hypothetical protein
VIWFAPFQGVGDDDELIVRVKRPANAPQPLEPEPLGEERP